jgi:HPt (histidine-containing phosphotransfer) domain-containing protein
VRSSHDLREPPLPAWPRPLAELCAEELRKRLPVLLDAIEAGDCPTARSEAHAMKGVAANFGLLPLAESLDRLEVAARGGVVPDLRIGAAGLPPQVHAALDRLLGAEA